LAKPSSPLSWSTDTNYSAGPETGTPTKVDPAGVASQGWVAGRAAPASWMNWVLNKIGAWTSYLDNLHNESAFLGEQYVWTNYHQFDSAPTFVDGAQFQGPVAFLDDVTFDGPVSLFDGTFVDGFIGLTGEVVYSTGFGDPPTPVPRTIMVPLPTGAVSAIPTGVLTATLSGVAGSDAYWLFTASGQVQFPLVNIPRGASLQNIRVGCSNASGGTVSITMEYVRHNHNKTTPSASTISKISLTHGSVAAGADDIFNMPILQTVDNSIESRFVAITSTVDVRIHWIEVNYLDPGPRNG
jgi:hypothetical protein